MTTNNAITYTNLVWKEEVINSKAGSKAKEKRRQNGASRILRALEALALKSINSLERTRS